MDPRDRCEVIASSGLEGSARVEPASSNDPFAGIPARIGAFLRGSVAVESVKKENASCHVHGRAGAEAGGVCGALESGVARSGFEADEAVAEQVEDLASEDGGDLGIDEEVVGVSGPVADTGHEAGEQSVEPIVCAEACGEGEPGPADPADDEVRVIADADVALAVGHEEEARLGGEEVGVRLAGDDGAVGADWVERFGIGGGLEGEAPDGFAVADVVDAVGALSGGFPGGFDRCRVVASVVVCVGVWMDKAECIERDADDGLERVNGIGLVVPAAFDGECDAAEAFGGLVHEEAREIFFDAQDEREGEAFGEPACGE